MTRYYTTDAQGKRTLQQEADAKESREIAMEFCARWHIPDALEELYATFGHRYARGRELELAYQRNLKIDEVTK